MSTDNARKFVVKMKENRNFREKLLEITRPEDLYLFLHKEGLVFDRRELVGAMAECMGQLELQSDR